jgi:hypothetical protein
MKLTVEHYIESRLQELHQAREDFQRLFYFLEDTELLFIPEGELWSAIECIEHLNNTAEHYLPQLTKICKRENATESKTLRLSWIAGKLRHAMGTAANMKMTAPKRVQPRRLTNKDLKIAPQKVMENFISDLDQIEKIVRILPASPQLRHAKITSLIPIIKLEGISALEILIPHIARHLKQAERILNGGRLAQEDSQNPDLIFPTAPKDGE